MCHRVRCERCGRVGWVGCGRHVDEVMAGVPESERCQCPPPKSLLSRFFGR